jgi:hypothetical protein
MRRDCKSRRAAEKEKNFIETFIGFVNITIPAPLLEKEGGRPAG